MQRQISERPFASQGHGPGSKAGASEAGNTYLVESGADYLCACCTHAGLASLVRISQIEERKRLHAKLMEKVKERSATRTITAEVGSHWTTADAARQCTSR